MSWHLFVEKASRCQLKSSPLVCPPSDTTSCLVSCDMNDTQEWDTANGNREQQLITITNAVSGTFRLSLDGAVTASIPHNAPASRIASALANLPNVAAPTEVVKERKASPFEGSSPMSSLVSSTASIWRVAFASNVGDLPLLTVQVS